MQNFGNLLKIISYNTTAMNRSIVFKRLNGNYLHRRNTKLTVKFSMIKKHMIVISGKKNANESKESQRLKLQSFPRLVFCLLAFVVSLYCLQWVSSN